MTDRKTDNIVNIVKDVSNNIDEFKSMQSVSGKSFVNYSVSSNSAYDFAITMNVTNRAFRVIFTHELPDKYNIVDLSWFMRVDNSNVMASPRVSNAVPYTTEVCFEAPQLGVTTWILDCSNLDYSSFPSVNTHTFYFKFYFNGTTTGTFNAVTI